MMWKPNSARISRYHFIFIAAISVSMLVACSSSATNATLAPTSTLIPPTNTSPPITPPPTLTPLPVISAASLAGGTPEALDAIQDEQMRAVGEQVYDDLIPRRAEAGQSSDLRLIVAEEGVWRNARLLGCPKTTGSVRIDGYRFVFVDDNFMYEYHTDAGETIRLCSTRAVDEAEDDLLLLVDPIAAELFGLAQRRVGRERDVPSVRVELETMRTVQWNDSSLGCPDPDQLYEQIPIDGYRLVVSVSGSETIFHTDFQSLVECAPDQEVLPQPDAEATPEATPES
jgi:hypothetical protein